MTALALELDSRLQKLDPETLKEVETLFLDVLNLAEKTAEARAHSFPRTTPHAPKAYRAQPRPLGLRAGLSYDNVGELLAALEGEDWK